MIKIQRAISTPHYTEGKIFVGDELIGDTLELPWRNNQTDVSCIPAATAAYRLVKRAVGRFAAAYRKRWGHDGSLEIKFVNGRLVILIHTGVSVQDTLGCPLVGQKLEPGRLWKSRDTYSDLWDALEPHWADFGEDGIPLEVSPAICLEGEAEFSMNERLLMKPEEL